MWQPCNDRKIEFLDNMSKFLKYDQNIWKNFQKLCGKNYELV